MSKDAMSKDAISLLKTDHAEAHKLFVQEEKLGKNKGAEKKMIFDKIKTALELHAAIEEEIFYPAVKKARAEHVKDEVREAYEEHKQIKTLVAEIAGITPDDESYDMKIKVLREDVEHHVKEEEGEMFPDAKKFLGEKRLVALGAEMEARKMELSKNHGAEVGAQASQAGRPPLNFAN